MTIRLTGKSPLLFGALLATAASAQNQLNTKRVTAPAKNGDTYYPASGTRTHAGAWAGAGTIGPEVIYNNTGAITYFLAAPTRPSRS